MGKYTGDLPPKDGEDGYKFLYSWNTTKKYPRRSDVLDDHPDTYVVYAHDKAAGGIVVWGLYGNRWVCNPSLRLLVRHLLNRLNKVELR